MKYRYFVLLLITLSLSSCYESKFLLENLNKCYVPLEYLHDSKINECDKSTSIALTKCDIHVFDAETSVTKINHKVLPFIVFNYEEINLAVKLGQNSLEQNYYIFFRKSFDTESQRTGCYSLTDNPEESDYSIEITYDTCEVNSIFQRSSTVIFVLAAYSMNFQELGFPAKTDLVLNVKLKKENDLVFEKKYSVERTQPFVKSQSNKIYNDFVVNLAESLSMGTKDCIEQIIKDINQVIETQKGTL